MIDEKAKIILKRAMSTLGPKEIERYREHLKRETPVLCGRKFEVLDFCDGSGG